MHVQEIKTHKITDQDQDLFKILDQYISSLEENSVVAITSKIVAITQGRVVKVGEVDKTSLVHQEAQYYIPADQSKYGFTITIKEGLLIPTAGIDESNANGFYVLWPKDLQQTANQIREHLQQKFSLKNVGVIITDSKTTPLRWGVTGVGIVHSGFEALNNYIGQPDIFGKQMKVTKVNVMDALAASAVLVMGEGQEQTPLAIISELPFVHFQSHNPTQEELDSLKISLEDDLYEPILTSVKWQKGQG